MNKTTCYTSSRKTICASSMRTTTCLTFKKNIICPPHEDDMFVFDVGSKCPSSLRNANCLSYKMKTTYFRLILVRRHFLIRCGRRHVCLLWGWRLIWLSKGQRHVLLKWGDGMFVFVEKFKSSFYSRNRLCMARIASRTTQTSMIRGHWNWNSLMTRFLRHVSWLVWRGAGSFTSMLLLEHLFIWIIWITNITIQLWLPNIKLNIKIDRIAVGNPDKQWRYLISKFINLFQDCMDSSRKKGGNELFAHRSATAIGTTRSWASTGLAAAWTMSSCPGDTMSTSTR